MCFEGQSGLLASHESPATSYHSDRATHDDTIAKSSKRPRESLEVDCIPISRKDASVDINSQQSKNTPSQVLTNEDLLNIKCKLANPDLRNVVAHGTILFSSSPQMIHGVPLRPDCYKVSVDKKVKPTAFLPIQSGEHKTVEEAYESFVPWPKSLVIPDSKVPQTTSNEHKEKQKKKTKKSYTKTPKHTRSTFNKKNIGLDDA
ncbi:hypothetical protein L6452_14725 [Arctium lappa]|uniref:Uncharacterized protein n=1 Tax=Arctium lappa TaxID=4217 RepID=A0ACB9CLM5_ARCLA|nr:hypothetical protein L6452_14725 [Arctium lappa]